MNCREARAEILEARLVELDGSQDTPLAAHLRSCPGCRAAAERVLAGTAFLARAVERAAAEGPRRPAEEVLQAWKEHEARVTRVTRKAPGPAGSRRRRRDGGAEERSGSRDRGRRRRWPWLTAGGVGLAAAAAVAGLFLRTGPEPSSRQATFPPRTAAVEPRAPLVEGAGGASFAVFETSNPDITVVWIYEEEET